MASLGERGSDGSDAVAIVTTLTDYDLALTVLRAGKHIFAEKPLAQTSEQVRRSSEKPSDEILFLMVDHTCREIF